MQNRRQEQRTLCADLVDVSWRDRSGHTRWAIATLEDISQSGACLQVDRSVARGTLIRISYPKGELQGR
ncbi:MAG: PilZ domain-containing protein, partial [Bryobacteraceae bacterium]